MYSLNLVFGAIENCIHSIWTLGRLKIVFTQSENLEDDWNLYSLNLEFSYNGQKIQIRILMIETLSTQLFGDVEFSFLFHHNNQFYPCEILSLSLSLSFLCFELWIIFFSFFSFFFWKISLFMKLMPQILEKILKTIISFPFFNFSFFYSFCKIKNPFLSFSLCFFFFFFFFENLQKLLEKFWKQISHIFLVFFHFSSLFFWWVNSMPICFSF